MSTALAKQAYHAYGVSVEFKNFQGDPMPEWDQLGESIQGGWVSAAAAAANLAVGELIDFKPDEAGNSSQTSEIIELILQITMVGMAFLNARAQREGKEPAQVMRDFLAARDVAQEKIDAFARELGS